MSAKRIPEPERLLRRTGGYTTIPSRSIAGTATEVGEDVHETLAAKALKRDQPVDREVCTECLAEAHTQLDRLKETLGAHHRMNPQIYRELDNIRRSLKRITKSLSD